jgi:hypothetical protein
MSDKIHEEKINNDIVLESVVIIKKDKNGKIIEDDINE